MITLHELEEKFKPNQNKAGWVTRLARSVKSLFDIREHPERCNGFFRIHPSTARRLHEDFVLENLKAEYNQNCESDQFHSQPFAWYPKIKNLEQEGQAKKKKISIEKAVISACSITIALTYPIAMYFALYK